MSDHDELPPDPDQKLYAMITDHFLPSGDGEVERRSTVDILRIIDSIAPGMFSASNVYIVMRSAEFRTALIGEELLWEVYRR